MLQPVLDQCHIVQTKLENLLQKTVALSSQVYQVGFFDFKAVNLESKIRDIESQVKALVQEAKSATKSVDSVQNSLQRIKVSSKVLEEVKSINEICEQINTIPPVIDNYLEDMSTFLASNNLFGAFMNLIRGVQYALQEITMSTIEIANLVVIPALPGISSFFSRLLPGIGQKLLGGR